MYSYSEMYVEDARENLAEAFEYVVYDCKMDPDEFMQLFIASGLADLFGGGSPKYICGMPGVELAKEVLNRTGRACEKVPISGAYDRSEVYWAGWILAYYQWVSGRSMRNIVKYISVDYILRMYPTYHETADERFADAVDERIAVLQKITNLQRMRRFLGYSQRMLSEKSGVSLRMIQQYEQRAKDINKATGTNLNALADVLGCRMEDLLEK